MSFNPDPFLVPPEVEDANRMVDGDVHLLSICEAAVRKKKKTMHVPRLTKFSLKPSNCLLVADC